MRRWDLRIFPSNERKEMQLKKDLSNRFQGGFPYTGRLFHRVAAMPEAKATLIPVSAGKGSPTDRLDS
jgi:hypothetical protein